MLIQFTEFWVYFDWYESQRNEGDDSNPLLRHTKTGLKIVFAIIPKEGFSGIGHIKPSFGMTLSITYEDNWVQFYSQCHIKRSQAFFWDDKIKILRPVFCMIRLTCFTSQYPHYLTRAVYSLASDPVKPVVAVWAGCLGMYEKSSGPILMV